MRKKQQRWWIVFLIFPTAAFSQADSFRETAQRTLLTNPEVQVRFHSWQAAKEERAAAAGGYFPRVDVTASSLREERRRAGLNESSYRTEQATVTLTQMLFDGFATRNEVARLDHAALVRFFELHDISENITLEVVRAYADVARYRELVALAEENFARHRAIFDLIQEKVEAGVGRRVDLETSSGRTALAETNLLTELANLHDVTARFIRLTGKPPAPDISIRPNLSGMMPKNAQTALAMAVRRNPSLWAALQNVRAAKSAASVRDASYLPRFDFQVRSNGGRNLSGIAGDDATNSAGVVMNWNLFNGGSDMARARQAAQQINAAQDMLDRGCRDLRQTLLIAYNDTQKLAAQIGYLNQHQLATEKARDAYRMQFDIGQRSLLDLLDTENELFQARRAYTNAVHDLEIAYARVSASMGQLVPALGLTAPGADKLAEVFSDDETRHLVTQCQQEMPINYAINQEAIEKRVIELKRESAATASSINATPQVIQIEPVAPGPKVPVPVPLPKSSRQP
jgi:adhesin transport system outer membrane protein